MRSDTTAVDTNQLVQLITNYLYWREDEIVAQPELIRAILNYYEFNRTVYKECRWFDLEYVLTNASFFTNFEDAIESFGLTSSWEQWAKLHGPDPEGFLLAQSEEADADSIDFTWVHVDNELHICAWTYKHKEEQ